MLLDPSTLEQIFSHLSPVYFVNLSVTNSEQELLFSKERVLAFYSDYIEQIKAGKEVDHLAVKKKLSLHMTKEPSSCYKMGLDGRDVYFVKEREPGIRVMLHQFAWDLENKETHSNVHGKGGISWGLEFSYPQIFGSSLGGDVIYLAKEKQRANTLLFTELKRLVRRFSKPVAFLLDGQRVQTTLRIDDGAKAWVGAHQGMKDHGIEVAK